jgi:hypothetical protein
MPNSLTIGRMPRSSHSCNPLTDLSVATLGEVLRYYSDSELTTQATHYSAIVLFPTTPNSLCPYLSNIARCLIQLKEYWLYVVSWQIPHQQVCRSYHSPFLNWFSIFYQHLKRLRMLNRRLVRNLNHLFSQLLFWILGELKKDILRNFP